jgi:hypothetical protein
MKRSEQSWTPNGSPGASTSKSNEKVEKVLNDPKKIVSKPNVDVNESLKGDIQRPKTTQAWVPRKN